MKRLKVQCYPQYNDTCAIASIASIANHFDSEIDYDKVYKIAENNFDRVDLGLNTGEMCILLNKVGFEKVTLVSANLEYLDFSWTKLSRGKVLEKLQNKKELIDESYTETHRDLCKWLGDYNYCNKIIVDYDFLKYAKESLDKSSPPMLSFNWTMLFKEAKRGIRGKDSVKGFNEYHAVAVNGYTKDSFIFCDSDETNYKKFKRYSKNEYKIPICDLMIAMSDGDMFIANKFNKNIIE